MILFWLNFKTRSLLITLLNFESNILTGKKVAKGLIGFCDKTATVEKRTQNKVTLFGFFFQNFQTKLNYHLGHGFYNSKGPS